MILPHYVLDGDMKVLPRSAMRRSAAVSFFISLSFRIPCNMLCFILVCTFFFLQPLSFGCSFCRSWGISGPLIHAEQFLECSSKQCKTGREIRDVTVMFEAVSRKTQHYTKDRDFFHLNCRAVGRERPEDHPWWKT